MCVWLEGSGPPTPQLSEMGVKLVWVCGCLGLSTCIRTPSYAGGDLRSHAVATLEAAGPREGGKGATCAGAAPESISAVPGLQAHSASKKETPALTP